MKALFFLLLSFSAFTQENCAPAYLPQELSPLLEINRYVSWNAASVQEVSGANCRKGIPTPATMNALFNSFSSPARSESVNGVELQNERPELIQAFRELTTMRTPFGDRLLPESQINLSIYPIPASCKKVLCAMENIWGTMASKMLYMKLHYDLNSSEHSIVNSSRFTDRELDDVLMGLGDLPPELIRAGRPNQQIVHYHRGELPSFHQDRNTQADSLMNFYDRWSEKSSPSRQYVVFHEMAHNISHHLGNLDGSPRFLETAGWIKTGEEWEKSSQFCAVSNYGSTDPDEDFAETVAAYRYSPASLRDHCPGKYEYMKAVVFRGREYLNQANCQ